MRSILAKSLLIDVLLTSICLSHGDNPRGVFAAWRVGNHNHPANEQTQGDKPHLSIIEAAIHESDARPRQHLFSVREIQPVLDEVATALRCVACVIIS
jgi:hypothetical protein